jgi:malonyl CoA-acyl carrier protein transacylase
VLVVVAPGQGSQTPGFLTPWLEVPNFRDRLEWLSLVSGIDLVRHGTESDADTIRDTAVAQPLIVSAGLVSLLSLFPHPSEAYTKVGAGSGHSVGEITAAVGAGVITAEQAMVLVRERGRAMAEASAVTPTGMTAVLGGDRDDVVAKAEAHGLTAANENGAGQIVVAGTLEQLAAFAADPPEKARLRPLQVAGAFHTSHMGPAVAHMASIARNIYVHSARLSVISNADGTVVHSGREVLTRLVTQVSSPVRWDLCMATMADLGPVLEADRDEISQHGKDYQPAAPRLGSVDLQVEGLFKRALLDRFPDGILDPRSASGDLDDTLPLFDVVLTPVPDGALVSQREQIRFTSVKIRVDVRATIPGRSQKLAWGATSLGLRSFDFSVKASREDEKRSDRADFARQVYDRMIQDMLQWLHDGVELRL